MWVDSSVGYFHDALEQKHLEQDDMMLDHRTSLPSPRVKPSQVKYKNKTKQKLWHEQHTNQQGRGFPITKEKSENLTNQYDFFLRKQNKGKTDE